MKKVLFLLVAMVCILAATAATWAYAQDSGQASGGVNGSVEEITPPKTAANPPAPSCKPNVVGGREIAYDQQGNFAGYGTPKMSTANQDKDWRKFASRQGWLTRREASALDAQILRKSKAYADLKDREVLKAAKGYTDSKVREVHKHVDRLNTRVSAVEQAVSDLDTATSDGFQKLGNKITNVSAQIGQTRSSIKGAWFFAWIALILAAIAIVFGLVCRRRLCDLEKDFYGDGEQQPTTPAPARLAGEDTHPAPETPTPTGEEDVLAAEVDPTRI